MKQYIVDAFTHTPFTGNPAAVCVMEQWPKDEWMMKLAQENNLSETAFLVKEGEHYHLRWFTPGCEVELCGHATLASAFVILNFYTPQAETVVFDTLSGPLTIHKEGEFYRMDFPSYELQEIPVTDEMTHAFGTRPSQAVLGLDLICVFDDERVVEKMSPDQKLLSKLPGRIQNASAKGTRYDCVSRSFCPKLAIEEDPVCGSAHVQIASYWSRVLNKQEIFAYQASKRTGELRLTVPGEGRVFVKGEACLIAISELKI